MPRYALQDTDGRTLAIAEAANSEDAALWGARRLPGFKRVGDVAEAEREMEALNRRLDEAMTDISRVWGGPVSDAGARSSDRNRLRLPVVHVPPQKAGDGSQSLTERTDAAAAAQITELNERLDNALRRAGMLAPKEGK